MEHLPSQPETEQDRVASAILVVLARLVALLFAVMGRTQHRRRGVSLAAGCGIGDRAEVERLADLWGNTRIWAMVLPAVFPADAVQTVRADPSAGPSHEGRGEEAFVRWSAPVALVAPVVDVCAVRHVRPASCADPPDGRGLKEVEQDRHRHADFVTIP